METSNSGIAQPAARWFLLVMTAALAAAGAAQFISIGTRQANLWALGLVVLPLAVWWDAARVVLWLLAMYAADLAQGVECDC